MQDFRDKFVLPAQKGRKWKKFGGWSLALGGVLIFSPMLVYPTKSMSNETGIIFVIGWIFWMTGIIFLHPPSAKCPACSKKIDGERMHCPICGGIIGKIKKWYGIQYKCEECLFVLKYGKGGRRFKIHNCMACGVKLDDTGY